MRNLKSNIFVVSAVALLMLGFATAYFLNTTEAQSSGKQTPRKETAWRPVEIPLKTDGSQLRLNLSSFSQETDSIVGVKSIREDEKEKMLAGVITWGEVNEKVKGLVIISKVDNYPQESANFVDEEMRFANVLNNNQTLMVYLELKPSTQLKLNQAGEELALDASNGSYVVFDGKREPANIKDAAFLLTEAQLRKVRKEAAKVGNEVRNIKEEN